MGSCDGMLSGVEQAEAAPALGKSLAQAVQEAMFLAGVLLILGLLFFWLFHLRQPTPGTIYRNEAWIYDWTMRVDGLGEHYEIYKRCKGLWVWCVWDLETGASSWQHARNLIDSREEHYRRTRLKAQWFPVRADQE